MAGSYLFGGIDALGFNLQVLGVPVSGFILNMLPYIFTVLVLVLVLKRRGGRSASPQALGLSYDREEDNRKNLPLCRILLKKVEHFKT